ncbi:hypothetical protein JB92DRAFT_2825191 [Gautieria morchelliformis]|nr:hypothetical protein JB92DRAFT_2825191 [Gautieria morchelliformis]
MPSNAPLIYPGHCWTGEARADRAYISAAKHPPHGVVSNIVDLVVCICCLGAVCLVLFHLHVPIRKDETYPVWPLACGFIMTLSLCRRFLQCVVESLLGAWSSARASYKAGDQNRQLDRLPAAAKRYPMNIPTCVKCKLLNRAAIPCFEFPGYAVITVIDGALVYPPWVWYRSTGYSSPGEKCPLTQTYVSHSSAASGTVRKAGGGGESTVRRAALRLCRIEAFNSLSDGSVLSEAKYTCQGRRQDNIPD